jgi:hypothetical protein
MPQVHNINGKYVIKDIIDDSVITYPYSPPWHRSVVLALCDG